jgi:hypothetical protein
MSTTTPDDAPADPPAPKPSGPTAKDIQAAARELSLAAIATLKAVLEGDSPPTAKVAAAREVLSRAHGKVKVPRPRGKEKARRRPVTVIVKRFSDVTPEEEAAAEATERGEL